MSRAGREPAEDVKRRLTSACSAANLTVTSARMYLRKHQRDRIIVVGANPSDWEFEHPMVTLLTVVTMSGNWSGCVDIRCSASETDSVIKFWDIPIMVGRHQVHLDELANQLRETAEERSQVIAARRLGITGPYHFERARWEKPGDLLHA